MKIDQQKLRLLLERECGEKDVCSDLLHRRPHLFATAAVLLERDAARRMEETAAAVEAVVGLPAYADTILGCGPAIARHDPGARGVFVGYDFHLAEDGPKLIEVNTNAGGGMLNAKLAATYHGDAAGERVEVSFVEMFREEWRLRHGDRPLRRVLIVDDEPAAQYLYPEFLLFRSLFRRHGLEADIADASELSYRDGVLLWRGEPVDLVYNRLTDFLLEEPRHEALRRAYLDGSAMVTPHPRAHALYADKRNLALLSDAAFLRGLAASDAEVSLLRERIPTTEEVTRDNADRLWQARRGLFFKPVGGFAGKGAYRGEKLTLRTWEHILAARYVAQTFVPPSQCELADEAHRPLLKVDFRLYTYAGKPQLMAARLYRGQTTNFRTPLGGFAPVRLK